MSVNLVNKKTSTQLEEHQRINQNQKLQEDIEYYEDKILQIKLNQVKIEFQLNKKTKFAEEEFKKLNEENLNLKNELEKTKLKLEILKNEDRTQLEKLNSIRNEIQFYEEKNSELHNDFLHKINYLKMIHQPENLMKHLLQFDQETLKTLCIKLNKIQNEKLNYMMQMQQQYYNQMMFNNMGMMPVQNMQHNIQNLNQNEEDNSETNHIN